jgi:hypothetical protein
MKKQAGNPDEILVKKKSFEVGMRNSEVGIIRLQISDFEMRIEYVEGMVHRASRMV